MATQLNLLDLRDVPRRMLQLLDEMHADSPDRWIPRRAIFANWWLFTDTQAFHFGRGNLMLTGRNESGKTSVLVAILTLVLDRILYGHRYQEALVPKLLDDLRQHVARSA